MQKESNTAEKRKHQSFTYEAYSDVALILDSPYLMRKEWHQVQL